MEDFEIFDSPTLIWQGMSENEINQEIAKLRSRRQIIDRFIDHIKTTPSCDPAEYEHFCDLMLTEGVNPNLWIEAAVKNIDHEIEALIENANS